MKSKAASTTYAIYYYHPDHLGTNNLLTDMNGNPYQLYLNLPFGETMAEQTTSSGTYQSPYKFNGKELDAETGLYYYGARYYDAKASVWLSVDPLGEKYAGLSPYNYALNNPVVLVDPDGRSPVFGVDGILLGTDKQGMRGKIIIANDPSKFTQGMKHSDALKLGSTFSKNRTDMTMQAKINTVSKVLEGTELPNNTKKKLTDFKLTLQNDPGGIGDYDNGKINLDFKGNDDWTVENIRMVGGIHEFYGHGIMRWGDRFSGGGTHRKCYEAEMDSKYWDGATNGIKRGTVDNYWGYYWNEVYKRDYGKTNASDVPEKYRAKYFQFRTPVNK